MCERAEAFLSPATARALEAELRLSSVERWDVAPDVPSLMGPLVPSCPRLLGIRRDLPI